MIYIDKNWSLVLFCFSILTLGSALIAEHFFNLAPCDMCLKQRHPYYALIVLVVFFYLFKKDNHILFLLFVELLILYGLFYAIWHVGIEQNILKGPASCSGSLLQTDSVQDLKQQITNKPVVSCSEVIWAIGGISAATLNTILLVFICIFNTMFIIRYFNAIKN